MTQPDPEILDLALCLGIHDPDPEAGILRHCLERVDRWVKENGGVSSASELENLVLSRLRMVVEEVDRDEDFERLAREYALQGNDPIFSCLQPLFEDDVFGALIQRRHSPDQVVAVIDCRGSKANRRYFTRWHEIAHRLTTHAKLPKVLFRSGTSPLESLVDEVASQIGFYRPLLEQAIQASGGKPFSIQKVSGVAKRFPGASFKATLLACVKAHPEPVTFLEVEDDLSGLRIKRQLANHSAGTGKDLASFLSQGGFLSRLVKADNFQELFEETPQATMLGIKVPASAYGLLLWNTP